MILPRVKSPLLPPVWLRKSCWMSSYCLFLSDFVFKANAKQHNRLECLSCLIWSKIQPVRRIMMKSGFSSPSRHLCQQFLHSPKCLFLWVRVSTQVDTFSYQICFYKSQLFREKCWTHVSCCVHCYKLGPWSLINETQLEMCFRATLNYSKKFLKKHVEFAVHKKHQLMWTTPYLKINKCILHKAGKGFRVN